MYPILLQWGDFIIPSWHAMFAIGGIAAFFVLQAILSKTLPNRDPSVLFVSCYLAGYFGARSFAILVEEARPGGLGDFISRLFTFGAMTFYGGFIAAILVGSIVCYLQKLNIWKVADAALTAGMCALAIGRIGCFLNGDDYGIPVLNNSQAWWAVTFPNHPEAIPRVPVQLFEAGLSGSIFIVAFRWAQKATVKPGNVALCILGSYAICRFFLEFLRGDMRSLHEYSYFSPAQQISIGLILIANFLFAIRCIKKSS